MKKISWHYPHLKYWMGGTKFLYEVAIRINKKSSVDIITNSGQRWVISQFTKNQINVFTTTGPFYPNPFFFWFLFPVMFIWDTIKTYFYIKKSNILVATLFPSNLTMALLSLLTNKPYFYYCYEPYPYFHNREFINSHGTLLRVFIKITALIYKQLDLWAAKRATKIFTLNNIMQKAVYRIYHKHSVVTYMGVDTNLFKKYSNNKINRRYKKNLLIVHSTDYTPAKKTDLAIAAIKKLVVKFPNILLLITSTLPDSPNKQRYQKIINQNHLNNNVRLLGLVSSNDLPLFYSAAICYLSCSDDKMLGTTSSNLPVKEAMACATPAIRVNITDEDIEDSVSGFLVEPNDIDATAKKIKFLIEYPKKRLLMGEKGRQKIIKLYNWDKVTQKIISCLN